MNINKQLLSKTDLKIDKYFLVYLIAIYLLYVLEVTPSVFLIISGIFATVLFGWIILIEYKYNPIKISPVLVLSVIPVFMLGVSSIYHGIKYINQDYDTLAQDYVSTTSIIIGYLIVATGLFFQFLGVQFFSPKQKLNMNITEKKNEVRIVKYFIIFLIVSKLTGFYLVLGALQFFLGLIPLSILIFVAIKDNQNLQSSFAYKRNFILIGSAVLFVSDITLLSKTNLVFSFIPVFLFYLMSSQKTNKYKLVLVAVLLSIIYFLFVQPLVSNARVYLGIHKQEASIDILADYILSGEYKFPIYESRDENTQVEIFLSRMFEIKAPAFIYEQTERSGFKQGSTLSNIGIGLIPRIFWSDKPRIIRGNEFATLYFNQPGNNIGMLISGELYWNFGFLGAIIGSFILGLSIGYIYKLVAPYVFKNFIYFTVYFSILQSCLGGSEFSAVFLGSLHLIILFWLIRFAHINFFKKT